MNETKINEAAREVARQALEALRQSESEIEAVNKQPVRYLFWDNALLPLEKCFQLAIDKATEPLHKTIAGLREALRKLLVNAVEFSNDHKKGDFELCKLAEYDMDSLRGQFERASKALSSTQDFSKMFVKVEEVEKAFTEGFSHAIRTRSTWDEAWLQSNARKVVEGI